MIFKNKSKKDEQSMDNTMKIVAMLSKTINPMEVAAGSQWQTAGTDSSSRINYLMTASDALYEGDISSIPVESRSHSIPDVFAQDAIFSHALFHGDDPKHADAVSEWRGILAMLLLSDEMKLNIGHPDIDFNSLNDNDSPFLHAAKPYLPNDSNGKLTMYIYPDGTDVGIPIAFSSCKTIICPAHAVYDKLVGAPPWMFEPTNGQWNIGDVCEYFKQNETEENIALAFRLKKLLKSFSSTALTKPKEITDEINAFINDMPTEINPSYVLVTKECIIPDYFSSQPTTKTGDSYDLFEKYLFSDKLCLFTAPDHDNGLFCSCYGKYAVTDSETKETTFMALMPLSEKGLKNIWQDCIPDKRPEQIMTMLDNIFGDVEMTSYDTYVDVRVSLKMTKDSPIETVRFNKRYPKKDCVVDNENATKLEAAVTTRMPNMAVWPNKYDPDENWKCYYTYFCSDVRDTFNRDGFTIKIIDPASQNRDSSMDRTITKGYRDITREFSITRTSQFPFFIAFQREGVEIGIFIARPTDAIRYDKSKYMAIGIDFGTTGTIAYSRQLIGDGHNPEPVAFRKPSLLWLSGEQNEHRKTFYSDFMNENALVNSEDKRANSFFTYFRPLEEWTDTSANQPFLDGSILFVDPNESILEEKRLKANLKWDDTITAHIYTKAFLIQTCMLCQWYALENGCYSVSWRFSHPSSLRNRDAFKEIAVNATEMCAEHTGISFLPSNDGKFLPNTDSRKSSFEFTTESHAAGLYQRHPRNQNIAQNIISLRTGFISVDIGGGSTDISIWQSDNDLVTEAVLETSIPMAGRAIVSDNISRIRYGQMDINRLNVLDKMGLSNEKKYFEKAVRERKSETFNQMFDLMIRNKPSIVKTTREGGSVSPLSNLLSIIKFNVGALFYLCGYMTRDLFAEKLLRKLKEDESFSIVLAGNGSRVLDYLNVKNVIPMLEHMICIGADQPDMKLQVICATEPKTEVAFGLVCRNHLKALDNRADDALAPNRTRKLSATDKEQLKLTPLQERRWLWNDRNIMDHETRKLDESMSNFLYFMFEEYIQEFIAYDEEFNSNDVFNIFGDKDVSMLLNSIKEISKNTVDEQGNLLTVSSAFVALMRHINKEMYVFG